MKVSVYPAGDGLVNVLIQPSPGVKLPPVYLMGIAPDDIEELVSVEVERARRAGNKG